jgi:hypothetical protein
MAARLNGQKRSPAGLRLAKGKFAGLEFAAEIALDPPAKKAA